jgi:hypothetical protein
LEQYHLLYVISQHLSFVYGEIERMKKKNTTTTNSIELKDAIKLTKEHGLNAHNLLLVIIALILDDEKMRGTAEVSRQYMLIQVRRLLAELDSELSQEFLSIFEREPEPET